MKPKITPRLPEFGSIQISVPVGSEPYEEGKYVPHLHIKAYHEKVKVINVAPMPDEAIEMEVPHGFYTSDMLDFMEENGEKIYQALQRMLDGERESPPEPLTYDSKVPYLGEYVPIRLADEETKEGFRDHAVYIRPGLSSGGIRDTVLKLFGDMAYGILKPRLDHFAGIMGVKYTALKIDDGRRTWGSFHGITRDIFMTRRMLMFSKMIIDSLIVHELAHSKETPHNEEFYNEIMKIMPDYEDADEAHMEAAGRLYDEGWI
jgi:predicted metal-dependent hydrolase